MGKFGWSYPPGCSGTPDDEPVVCESCFRLDNGRCDCNACPECGEVGVLSCYEEGHMTWPTDSVRLLIDRYGIEPLSSLMRAIDRHGGLYPRLLLLGPNPKTGTMDVDLDDREVLDALDAHVRCKGLQLSGIAWDGSDWEWSGVAEPAGCGWDEAIKQVETAFEDDLREHTWEMAAEDDSLEDDLIRAESSSNDNDGSK